MHPPHAEDFLVVGIGASAGGIKALKSFFETVPPDTGCAYVVILHLSPDFESRLAEILQHVSLIPVVQVQEDRVPVKPNHAYVVPPGKSMQMANGQLMLSPILTFDQRRAPIDIFFRTLSENYNGRSVAVILSGTGADGSMGMKRLKEMGGIVLAQDPLEAEYADMPQASIGTGLVDAVLPAAEMPEKIRQYREHLKATLSAETAEEQHSTAEKGEAAIREIFTHLRVRTGHDFSSYKRATVIRRIARRMSVREIAHLTDYAGLVKESSEESIALLKDLLISVTNFFRDRAAFEHLEQAIIPAIFEGKGPDDTVRVWVAGCATGEEAYSLAMLFAEQMEGMPEPPTLQIFATDIDEDAIAHAREGVYSNADVADVSPERLDKFFTEEGGGYFRVRRQLRESILFAVQNVLRDPAFSRLSLATCRNLLIYLNRAAQGRVLETIHFALQPGGYLMLGSAEGVDGTGDLYVTLASEQSIYQSRAVQNRPVPPVPHVPAAYRTVSGNTGAPFPGIAKTVEKLTLATLHYQVLEHYAPPSVLINADYDIVHLSKRAGVYLQIAGGEPSYNLLKAVRPELRMELRTTLYSANQGSTVVRSADVPIRIGGEAETVSMVVRPVMDPTDTARGFMLVLFEKGEAQTNAEVVNVSDGPEGLARKLEDELIGTRTQLRSSTEQYEVQAEELRASNEELQAINEELRSAAEELETGKEELQSVNEELTTVNQELKIKIDELSQSNNDFQNLMAATDIGTVFLDRTFNIKLFTPAAQEIFNLLHGDYGRPLSDITHRLVETNLMADAESVMQRLIPIEREVHTVDGKAFLMRLTPYRTQEDRISGVVATFVNISRRIEAEKSVHFQARLLDTVEQSVIATDLEGNVLYWNRFAERLFGWSAAEATGRNLSELVLPEMMAGQAQEIMNQLRQNKSWTGEFTVKRRDGTTFPAQVSDSPIHDAQGKLIGIIGVAVDITERRQADEALRTSEARFRTMTDAIPQLIWTNESGGVANYFNRRWYEYSGLTQEQSFGPGWQAMVHPDDAIASIEKWQRALRTGDVFDTEYRLRKADGTYRWFLGRNVPLHNEDGAVIAWFGSATDIEDRKQAEAARRQIEENMRLIMESVRDYAIYTMDLDRRITSWNTGAEAIFGYTEAEALGKLSDIIFVPEDIEVGAPQTEAEAALKHGRSADERWHTRKDGSRFYASGVMNLLHNGHVHGFVKVARDLTERKQAEEALRASEERLRIAMEAADMGTWDLDLRTNRVYWNEQHFRLFGLEPTLESVSLDEFFKHVHPDYHEPLGAQIQKAIETGGVFETEFCAVLKDGSSRWMSDYGNVIKNAQGESIRASGVMMDIHERKMAEEALRTSEERLRLATIVTQLGTCDWDYEGGVQRWNEVRFRMHGLEPEDRPVPVEEFFSLLHPEDHDHTKAVQVLGVEERGEHAEEYRTIWPDGTVRWIHEVGQVMERHPNGRPKRIISVTSDITDRKLAEEALRTSEQRYQAFVQQSTEGIWRFEMATPVSTSLTADEQIAQVYQYAFLAECNDAMAEMYGYDRAAEIIGWPIEHFLPHNEESEAYLKNFIASGYRIVNAESRERSKEGNDVYFLNNLIGIVEDGYIRRAWGTQSDITARKMLERQKDEFIGVASHELRTPVTSIKAYAETLIDVLQESGDATSAQLAQKLDAQVDRMRTLIHDLLDATRLTEGGGHFAKEPFDLGALISETADTLQRASRTHTIECHLDVLPTVRGDQERIGQVLNNLLTNAMKYSPHADKVNIRAALEKDRIVVSVQDFGIGIQEDAQAQVFERFFRAPDAAVSTYPGLGLGLYIAAEIVKRHEGEMWVKSKRGAGSSFFFTLPLS